MNYRDWNEHVGFSGWDVPIGTSLWDKPTNLTPWEVDVWSGYAHWDKLLEELCEAFPTEEDAENYATTLSKHRPEYRIEIRMED